jgi:hypothetical protein
MAISALGGVFVVLSIIFGIAVSKILKITLTFEERICFSILVGHSVSAMISYIASCLMGSLDFLTIGISMVLIFFATIFIIIWSKKRLAIRSDLVFSMERVFVILFGFVAFLLLNLRCVLREELGSLYGSSFVVGDYCFHISVVNSFVYRNNVPPQYPVIVDTPMSYPPLVDFLSAILVETGFDLRSSLIVPNLLFQVSLLCWIASLAIRIIGRKGIGVLSAFLFFFSSNMGILYAFNDAAEYGFMNWITNLPTDYTGSGVSPLPGIRFGNPVIVMLMPQRPSALGIGLSLIIYALILYSLKNEKEVRSLLFAGFLTGLLPSIHPHSFLAVSIVFLFTFILFKKDLKFLSRFLIPTAILALPQIIVIRTQLGKGFIGSNIGWLEENTMKIMMLNWSTPLNVFISTLESTLILSVFWIMNIGIILLPFILGFSKSDGFVKRFYLSYLMLFLLGNFIRFQPWDWDNYKIFLHWYILTIIIASFGILEVLRISYDRLRRTNNHKQRLITVLWLICLATILFFSMASGFLSYLRVFQENFLMWSKADKELADWVKENTPRESVFLTSTHFLNPIATLAGRQIILGYEGWLWSHGISWDVIQRFRTDIIKMFKGDYNLIKQYSVDFVVITHYEELFAKDNDFNININFFNESGKFEKVYDIIFEDKRYLVFKVL